MKPYEIINYILNDAISDVLDTHQFGLLYFPDFIRWNPTVFKQELTDLFSKSGKNIIPEDLEPCRSLKHDFYNGNFSYQSKWIKTEQRYSKLGKDYNKVNFLDHSYEPVYAELDKELWDDVKLQPIEYVIIHSEYNSKDIKNLNLRNIHWFSHAYLCSEFYFKHYQKLKMVTDYTARPILHRWLCTNRLIDVPRDYRIKFLNLIDTSQGMYSLLDKDPYTNRTSEEIYPGNKVLPNSFDVHENHSAEIKINDLTPWNTSFLHVVSETVWQDKIHFTEKVFKPIVLHQPFVVLQAPGSLAYLRSYGFKTFGDWWDESYDTIEDPQQRMQAIADIVNAIGAKSLEELETLRMEMASVLEHNFRHFYENIPAICLDELRKGIANL